jgi:hypothetical protein
MFDDHRVIPDMVTKVVGDTMLSYDRQKGRRVRARLCVLYSVVYNNTKKALKLFGKLRSREISDLLNSVLRHLKSFIRNDFTEIVELGVTKKAFRSFKEHLVMSKTSRNRVRNSSLSLA